MACKPRQFDRAFNGLRAAVGEERTLQAGELTKLLGQHSLKFVVVEIRKMDDLTGLFADRLNDPRMCMAQCVHAQARYEIKVAFAIQIVEKSAFPALKNQRIAAVGLQQKLTLPLDDLIRRAHWERLILSKSAFRVEFPVVRDRREIL